MSCHALNLEWTIAPWMARAQEAPGGHVTTRATFHNSGMLYADSAPAWAAGPFGEIPRYPSTFTARFPSDGDFPYACIAHSDIMRGSITVEG